MKWSGFIGTRIKEYTFFVTISILNQCAGVGWRDGEKMQTIVTE